MVTLRFFQDFYDKQHEVPQFDLSIQAEMMSTYGSEIVLALRYAIITYRIFILSW